MNPPLILPSYLCGACGHELLIDRAYSANARAQQHSVITRCYVQRCPQKGQSITIALQPASVIEAANDAAA